jgi:hypothetical protein
MLNLFHPELNSGPQTCPLVFNFDNPAPQIKIQTIACFIIIHYISHVI